MFDPPGTRQRRARRRLRRRANSRSFTLRSRAQRPLTRLSRRSFSEARGVSMSATEHQDGLSRRAMLSRSATGVGIVLSGSVGGLFGASPAGATGRGKPGPAGYGPLVPDPNGLLSLPEGFSYKIVAQSGITRLDSGAPTP